MLFSKELLLGVLKEMRSTPRDARAVWNGSVGIAPTTKYFYGKHKNQYLCYFQPKNIDPSKPVLVFYHGGCWMAGRPEIFTNRARIFVEQGYPVFMPTHRKIPYHWYPDIKEDLISTFKQLPELLAVNQLKDRPIVLGGMSSGGNLAALAAYDESIFEAANFSKDQILATLYCAAPLNLEGMPDSVVLRGFAGKKSSNAFRLASPINHLTASHTQPTMIVHGEEDGLVAYRSIVAFKEKLSKVANCSIKFVTIPKGGHVSAVKWVGPDLQVRQLILEWMANLT